MAAFRGSLAQRGRPVVPGRLRETLEGIGRELDTGAARPASMAGLLRAASAGLAGLPVRVVAAADLEIAVAAGLFPTPVPTWPAVRGRLGARADVETLARLPDLARLFLHHRDGRVREAALARIAAPLGDAFLFGTIAFRLNDWAEPVRRAAGACADRTFPATRPEIVAEAAMFLLEQRFKWGRWAAVPHALDESFRRADVAAALAGLIRTARGGAPGRVLRVALRRDSLDPYLRDLATAAVLPAVRVIALRSLIESRATWPEGFRQEWIDKSLGRCRSVIAYGERRFAHGHAVDALIAEGAVDRAAAVRRVAADGLVLHRHALRHLDPVLRRLAADRNASVRERADFILRERARQT